MTYDKEASIGILNSKKPQVEKISNTLVTECLNYLNGKLVSEEMMNQINHLKTLDPNLTKTEIVEFILDQQERILRSATIR